MPPPKKIPPSPFKTFAGDSTYEQLIAPITRLVESGLVQNRSCAYDLLTYDDEWLIYPAGKIRALTKLLKLPCPLPELTVDQIKASPIAHQNWESPYLAALTDIDEVCIHLLFDVRQESALHP